MSLIPGIHRFTVREISQFGYYRLARYAARSLRGDSGAVDEPQEHIEVTCTCGAEDCDLALSYARGSNYGLALGSIVGTAYAAADRAETALEGAPLLPPAPLEVKLAAPLEVVVHLDGAFTTKSAGVVVERDKETGAISGVRPA